MAVDNFKITSKTLESPDVTFVRGDEQVSPTHSVILESSSKTKEVNTSSKTTGLPDVPLVHQDEGDSISHRAILDSSSTTNVIEIKEENLDDKEFSNKKDNNIGAENVNIKKLIIH